MSQADVAAAFNRSTTWVSKLESGEITPRADILLALSSLMNVDPAYILNGEASQMSPFMARIRSYGELLDPRGRQIVLDVVRAAVVGSSQNAASKMGPGRHGYESESATAGNP